MLRGNHTVSLDTKGRFAMFDKVREQPERIPTSPVIITLDHQKPCLNVYPPAIWQHIDVRLKSIKGNNRRVSHVVRLCVG